MRTSIGSEADSPSLGWICRNWAIGVARRHAESVSRPSILTGPPRRTATATGGAECAVASEPCARETRGTAANVSARTNALWRLVVSVMRFRLILGPPIGQPNELDGWIV